MIQAWLKKEFGKEFTNEGDNLRHGRQEDGFSCGVCLPNAIEYACFRDKLFVHVDRRLHRMKWFVWLGKAQADHVSHIHIKEHK